MLWIEYRPGEPIPKEFEYDGWRTDKNKCGGKTPLMLWIKHCKEPIPKELTYDGWQTDKDNYKYTPLMQWIAYREGETIPKELTYDGWKTDRNMHNLTPLMLWVLWRNTGETGDRRIVDAQALQAVDPQSTSQTCDIPKELTYDGWQSDKTKYG